MKKAVLWGCALIGSIALDIITYFPFEVYVDKNAREKDWKGSPFDGKRILSPDEFFEQYDADKCFVLICAFEQSTNSIKKTLESRGFQYGVHALTYADFMEGDYREKSATYLDYLRVIIASFSVTDYCTLKCKECSLAVPYRQNKRHKTLEQVKTETKMFFSKVDYSEELSYVGGEPLLWDGFPKYLPWLRKNFGGQYGEARIITNCTVPLSDEIQNIIIDNNIVLELTIYRDLIGDLAEQMVNKCKERGIKYKIIEHEAWMDFDIRRENQHSTRDNAAFYRNCSSFCRGVEGGEFIYCTPGYYSAVTRGLSVVGGSISIEKAGKDQLYRFYYGKMKEYPQYCKFCNGYNTAPLIPVAEQMK